MNLGTMEPGGPDTYSFENLILWQKAQEFSVAVAKLIDALPRRRSADAIGDQLMRAASSVAANIAESHGRFSFAAYRNHLSIAKGSTAEAGSWIDLAARLDYLDTETAPVLDRASSELIAALTRRIRALDAQEQRSRSPSGSKVQRFDGSGERASREQRARP